MVLVRLFLYGKPGAESGKEGSHVTGQELLEFLGSMADDLRRLSGIVQRLDADGWTFAMGLYDVEISHAEVRTHAEASARLARIGLDPNEFSFDEGDDEDG